MENAVSTAVDTSVPTEQKPTLDELEQRMRQRHSAAEPDVLPASQTVGPFGPKLESEKLTASEAIFAFCGMLTSRRAALTFGAEHDAAFAARLAAEFCQRHELAEQREGWEKLIVPCPTEESDLPEIRARLTVKLYQDGNAQVDGPFEDRILFKGLLGIAHDVEFEMYLQNMARARRAAHEARQPAAKKNKLRQMFAKVGEKIVGEASAK